MPRTGRDATFSVRASSISDGQCEPCSQAVHYMYTPRMRTDVGSPASFSKRVQDPTAELYTEDVHAVTSMPASEGHPVTDTLPDQGRSAIDGIYHELRRQIVTLERAPGSRLREEPLAEEFGVSRTPIRQVLGRLQHERLVTRDPGAGATVAVIDAKEVRDVWAVRLKLLELTDAFTSLPAPPAVVDDLRTIAEELEDVRTTRSLVTLGELYSRFNTTVLEVCTSTTMRRISDELFHLTAREWLRNLPDLDLDHEIDVFAEELAAIIDTLQGHDRRRLTAIRLDHMQRLLRRFNDHLSRPLG